MVGLVPFLFRDVPIISVFSFTSARFGGRGAIRAAPLIRDNVDKYGYGFRGVVGNKFFNLRIAIVTIFTISIVLYRMGVPHLLRHFRPSSLDNRG